MTENWHEDLQDLAQEYSPGYVITAFNVRDKIAEEGYEGIHFTDTTESHLEQVGPMVTKNIVEGHMNKELKKQK